MTSTRISMWAGPRNISTTMMRSFESRPDTAVIDEPFYAYYLNVSGASHPMRDDILAALPTDWRSVVSLLTGPAPGGEPIYFHKVIAYHAADQEGPFDWLEECRPFLLIRTPRAMVASYVKKYEDVAPIAESLIIQRRIHQHMTARNLPCPVVDAADILKNPEAILSALCGALHIPFRKEMLSWRSGPRESDGVWAPHWYDAVLNSTGFKPYKDRPVSLSKELDEIAAACTDDYEALFEARLTLANASA